MYATDTVGVCRWTQVYIAVLYICLKVTHATIQLISKVDMLLVKVAPVALPSCAVSLHLRGYIGVGDAAMLALLGLSIEWLTCVAPTQRARFASLYNWFGNVQYVSTYIAVLP